MLDLSRLVVERESNPVALREDTVPLPPVLVLALILVLGRDGWE